MTVCEWCGEGYSEEKGEVHTYLDVITSDRDHFHAKCSEEYQRKLLRMRTVRLEDDGGE